MASGSLRYGQANADEIVREIVTPIAGAKGVEPVDLPPLYDSIDPDRLLSFVEGGDPTASTSFHYSGLEVRVYGNGDVEFHQPLDDE